MSSYPPLSPVKSHGGGTGPLQTQVRVYREYLETFPKRPSSPEYQSVLELWVMMLVTERPAGGTEVTLGEYETTPRIKYEPVET